MSEIEMRDEYVVNINGELLRYDDLSVATEKVHNVLNAAAAVGVVGDFEGNISWYVDEVPATPYDELVDRFSESLHGGNTLDEMFLDRASRFLLVEENRTGGFWLTSGDDIARLVDDHLNQEFADDWSIEGVYDQTTGDEVSYTLQVVVT